MIRCLKCGETTLIDVLKSPSGQIVHVQCNICSHVSLITEHQAIRCLDCGGLGSHHADCSKVTYWAV